MGKRDVRTVDTDMKDVSIGSTIVLEDGSLATVTTVETRDIEVKQVKKVYYLEYEAADKKGRKQLWCSVHEGDEQVEMVPLVKSWKDTIKAVLSHLPFVP